MKAPIQYGPNVECLTVYLSVRQYISFSRISEYFKDAYNMPISQGSIKNLIDSFTKKSALAYLRIKENISRATVVGADETRAKINRIKHWVHTWLDPSNTFIAIAEDRGIKAIKDNFPNGLPEAILVSDA